MKVVINKCFGGFGLSKLAQEKYALMKNINPGKWNNNFFENVDVFKIYRADSDLIKIIEELGNDANDAYSELKIVEIPDNVVWDIQEYDGREWVAEKHRTWS